MKFCSRGFRRWLNSNRGAGLHLRNVLHHTLDPRRGFLRRLGLRRGLPLRHSLSLNRSLALRRSRRGLSLGRGLALGAALRGGSGYRARARDNPLLKSSALNQRARSNFPSRSSSHSREASISNLLFLLLVNRLHAVAGDRPLFADPEDVPMQSHFLISFPRTGALATGKKRKITGRAACATANRRITPNKSEVGTSETVTPEVWTSEAVTSEVVAFAA